MVEKEIPLTESEVIKSCQAGNREAFRFLVEQFQDVLYGTAFMMTGDRTIAEDQVQEAFISAWKNIRTFRIGYPIKPWLVRILVNKVLSYQRDHVRTVSSVDSYHMADPVTSSTMEKIEQHDRIERAIDILPEEQRQVVLLRYFTGLSLAETSTALGRHQGTIKSQAHRALEKLKYLIEEQDSV